jgi:hypothetical protein
MTDQAWATERFWYGPERFLEDKEAVVRRLICCIASVIAKPSFNCLSCTGVAVFKLSILQESAGMRACNRSSFSASLNSSESMNLADLLFNGHSFNSASAPTLLVCRGYRSNGLAIACSVLRSIRVFGSKVWIERGEGCFSEDLSPCVSSAESALEIGLHPAGLEPATL